jgi:hypothetical protein
VLRRQGFTHTYQSNGNGVSVLSVLTELTLWCKDGSFVWNEAGGAPVTHPADDPVGAVQRIAARFRQLAPFHLPTDSVRESTA